MKECIEFKEIGECALNIDKVIKKFTLLCRILQYGDKFFLLELTPKGRTKIKVSINAEDAREIIRRLDLKQFEYYMFVRATFYIPIG